MLQVNLPKNPVQRIPSEFVNKTRIFFSYEKNLLIFVSSYHTNISASMGIE